MLDFFVLPAFFDKRQSVPAQGPAQVDDEFREQRFLQELAFRLRIGPGPAQAARDVVETVRFLRLTQDGRVLRGKNLTGLTAAFVIAFQVHR